eukprot:scaffold36490_cov61-Phaeocystis_antarctica.AAC.3
MGAITRVSTRGALRDVETISLLTIPHVCSTFNGAGSQPPRACHVGRGVLESASVVRMRNGLSCAPAQLARRQPPHLPARRPCPCSHSPASTRR